MILTQLKITSFRNLESVSLAPGPHLNLIHGPNGSGKTSLLEAISVLAHGRSFRTRKFRNLIQQKAASFTLFGAGTESKATTTIGVTRSRAGGNDIRLNGQAARSAAQLARELPVLVLNGDSFALLEGPPKARRQFFDWLVFHVKPGFAETWAAYVRCVKQRNSLLRRDKITYSEVSPWDREIGRLGELIEQERLSSLSQFQEHLQTLLADSQPAVPTVEVSYQTGWKSEGAFADQLSANFPRDRALGYTSLGSHKSDLKITRHGVTASEVLSRGQQKALVAALYVAEARSYISGSERHCLLLVDDLPAELDAENVARVATWLNDTGVQLFITCVEAGTILDVWPNSQRQTKVFHVEQGSVTEQSQ